MAPIGEKIKELRSAAGMSREELARSASLDKNLLDRIEDEGYCPSVSVLVKISKSLDTRVGTILDGAESGVPVVIPAADEKDFGNANYSKLNLEYKLLAQNKSDRNMEPSLIEVTYADENDRRGSVHEGEEFFFVLEGEVELFYGNEHYELSAGESIYYDSVVPHKITTKSPGEKARVLAISYTPAY